ncbi:hypothetical protein JHK84_035914 [Glycine max]|nr:hypothetical protein JHK84_035914 [Glycine max]
MGYLVGSWVLKEIDVLVRCVSAFCVLSFGQNQVPGSGNGGDVCRGATTSQKLTIIDAVSYLKEVKVVFMDQVVKYDMFCEILIDFKAKRVNIYDVIKRVKELFKGHNNLILGFQTFLPKGYKITFDKDEAPSNFGQNQVPGSGNGGDVCGGATTSKEVTAADALSYLWEVKAAFQDQREKYNMFIEIMKDFEARRIRTNAVITRVKELFKGHNNLILGFQTFLPEGYEITTDKDDAPPK